MWGLSVLPEIRDVAISRIPANSTNPREVRAASQVWPVPETLSQLQPMSQRIPSLRHFLFRHSAISCVLLRFKSLAFTNQNHSPSPCTGGVRRGERRARPAGRVSRSPGLEANPQFRRSPRPERRPGPSEGGSRLPTFSKC